MTEHFLKLSAKVIGATALFFFLSAKAATLLTEEQKLALELVDSTFSDLLHIAPGIISGAIVIGLVWGWWKALIPSTIVALSLWMGSAFLPTWIIGNNWTESKIRDAAITAFPFGLTEEQATALDKFRAEARESQGDLTTVITPPLK